MPLLYRDAPLNSIWEGSGNVVALDVLRAAGRAPDATMEAVGALVKTASAAFDASRPRSERRLERKRLATRSSIAFKQRPRGAVSRWLARSRRAGPSRAFGYMRTGLVEECC